MTFVMPRFPWRRVKLSVLLLPVILTACQSMNETRSLGTDGPSFCSSARPILYSRHDTAYTREQVVAHNAVGKALNCRWAK
mgnify:CR=1 FL=1